MFVAAMGQLLDARYYRRFFNTVRGVWVEHPTLLAYIESREVYTGLANDVVTVGVRLRVQGPKGEQVYRELARVLWRESRVDLDREIDRATRAARDRAATVAGRGANQHAGSDNVTPTARGNARSYVVGRLRREAGTEGRAA